MLQGHCFVSRLDYIHLKSNHTKFQLNPIRNVLNYRYCVSDIENVRRFMLYINKNKLKILLVVFLMTLLVFKHKHYLASSGILSLLGL